MTLSSFIVDRREQILKTWEEDALNRVPRFTHATIGPLRDHLGELLDAIARDLDAASRTAPNPGDQAHAQATWSNVDAIATKHGAGRAHQGITLDELVPEFPALRSSVTRLWRQTMPSATVADLEDLIRFDEALDFALTQSVSEFMQQLNRAREMFLGILGHDLRNPLSTIISAGNLLRDEGFDCSRVRDVADRIVGTGERMNQLVFDLLDFTRTRMGGQIPIKPRDVDLGTVIRNIADESATFHQTRNFRVRVSGDLHGRWDDKRLSQAVGNLIANAIHHGAPDRPIDVSAAGTDAEVQIAVHNEGPPIPEVQRERLFEPLTGVSRTGGEREPEHLGLGLYIAKAIVRGHKGRIEVQSDHEHGTTVTIRLPKQNPATSSESMERGKNDVPRSRQ